METTIEAQSTPIGAITITRGGKPNGYRGDPGVFAATLVAGTRNGPFKSKDPKKPGEVFYMLEWTFEIHGQPEDNALVWYSTTESTGPRSALYGLIFALTGKQPPVGAQLDPNRHLIGRMCLVDVRENERGYIDVHDVTPMPAAMLATLAPNGAAADAKAAGVSVPTAQPAATPQTDDSLPF